MNKHEVGDKVLLQAEIKGVDETSFYPYHVSIDGAQAWVREEDIFEDSVKIYGKEDILESSVKSYEDGMNDAWDAARKIASSETDGGYSSGELCEIFGEESVLGVSKILQKLTAAEAAAKIADWEENKKIHVGDVVKVGKEGEGSFCGTAVVTAIYGDWYCLIFDDGETGKVKAKELSKTGRKVDVDGFLQQIKGGGDRFEL